MIGSEGQRVSVPVGMAGVSGLWFAVVGLMVWSTFGGPFHAGRWALLLAAAAAAWTVVVGVRRVCCRLSRLIVETVSEQIDAKVPEVIDAGAAAVVRHLELRELESQVARFAGPGSGR